MAAEMSQQLRSELKHHFSSELNHFDNKNHYYYKTTADWYKATQRCRHRWRIYSDHRERCNHWLMKGLKGLIPYTLLSIHCGFCVKITKTVWWKFSIGTIKNVPHPKPEKKSFPEMCKIFIPSCRHWLDTETVKCRPQHHLLLFLYIYWWTAAWRPSAACAGNRISDRAQMSTSVQSHSSSWGRVHQHVNYQ